MKKNILLCAALLLSLTGVAQQSYTAYIFIAEECPVCNYLGKTLKKISEEYQDDVKFVAVFPQKMSSYKTASVFKKKYGLDHFTIELDHDLRITNHYNASVTPEVVIVDDNDKILYQGRINNSYAAPGRMRHGRVTEDLIKALDAVVLRRSVPKPWPDPIGCFITKLHG